LLCPIFAAYCLTICQTTFSLIPWRQAVPVLQTHRKILPFVTPAARDHSSITLFTQSGTGSSDVPSFADEVHDSPVFIATLEVTKVKFDEFAAT